MDELPSIDDVFPNGLGAEPPQPDWIPIANEVATVLGQHYNDPFIMANELLPSQARAIAPVITRWLDQASSTNLLEGLLANVRGPQGTVAAPAITELLARSIDTDDDARVLMLAGALDEIADPTIGSLGPQLMALRGRLHLPAAIASVDSALMKLRPGRVSGPDRLPQVTASLTLGDARVHLGLVGWDGDPPPGSLTPPNEAREQPSAVDEALDDWWSNEPRVAVVLGTDVFGTWRLCGSSVDASALTWFAGYAGNATVTLPATDFTLSARSDGTVECSIRTSDGWQHMKAHATPSALHEFRKQLAGMAEPYDQIR